MLESGHSIADYQVVTPLNETPLFATYQVVGPGVDAARLLLIAADLMKEKKARQAFTDQAELLLGKSFPGHVGLLAAEASVECSYCVYPFPSGLSLEDCFATAFSVRRSLEMIKRIAELLGLSHAAGLWHGNISPATIFVDGDSISLDLFALASLLKLDFHSGVDPCYSSPELVRGEPLSAASDLYSLGIVLYRLLTGKVPFEGAEPFATAMLHVQQQPAPLPDQLALLQPLIDGLVQAVPADRWNAEQLVSEIDRYLLLPELDRLAAVSPVVPEATAEDRENGGPQLEDPSSIERLMEASDIASRIEQRLKDRAETIQKNDGLSADIKRASTARISAIGQETYRKKQDMRHKREQKQNGLGRLILLVAVGIAVGVIIFLTLFPGRQSTPQTTTGVPEALLAGLEAGSTQLEQGQVDAAEKTFSELAADYPLFPQAYNNLAALYARQGDLDLARTTLERAMATDEYYATVYRNLGTVYSEMARDSYGKALQLKKGQQVVSLQLFGGTQLVAVKVADGMKSSPAPPAKQQTSKADESAVAVAQRETDEAPVAAAAEKVEEIAVAAVAAIKETVAKQTESVTEVVMAPEPEAAEVFLRRWAAAWSAQDVPAYLSFYTDDFVPSSGISHEDWVKQRESRLTRPKSIEVELEDFALLNQADDKLEIEVTQTYKSDRYQDRTRKRFDLANTGEGWQIVRERSLGRVR